MGMDPVTQAAIVTALGTVGARIFAPQGQKLSSFEGSGALDPHATLTEAKSMIEAVFGQMMNRANSPVDLSDAYVQSPPSFSGGGLPMPIGVTGEWGKGKTAYNPHGGLDDTGGGVKIHITDPPVPADPGTSPLPAAPDPGGADPTTTPLPFQASKSQSLLDGLNTSMNAVPSPDLASGGPVRRTAAMPGAPTFDVSNNGAGDTSSRALGAVSLLLHLAKSENDNSGSLLRPKQSQVAA